MSNFSGIKCIGFLLSKGLFCVFFAGISAFAQGNSAAMPVPKLVVDPCKKDVARFQEDLRMLKASMGDEAAKAFQNQFLPKAEWDVILLNEGYCGLSKRLRDKKLVR
jgi:hypothetical protein